MTHHARSMRQRSVPGLRLVLAALLALAVAPAAMPTAAAQSVAGRHGLAPKRTWTWEDAIEFDRTLPPRLPPRRRTASPNVFPRPAIPGVPLREGVRPEDADPIARGWVPAEGPCGPFIGASVGVQFEALPDNVTTIPPDTMGAIGPRHAMTMLNTQVRIQDRGGITDFSTVSLGAFWPDLSNPFDPKLFYDDLSDRWIAVCPGSSQSAASEWSIAVSLTDDPTGGWGWITLDSDAANTRWADYPCVGFNDKWIVVTFNMLAVPLAPNPPTGPKMWVIDKAEMLGAGPNVGYTEFDIGFVAAGVTLQPAVCLDANVPDILIVDTSSFIDPIDGFPLIRLSRVTGPTASPSWQALPGSAYSTPGLFKAPHRFTTELRTAPQLGSTTPIEVGTARACNAVFRNGRLYFSHSGGGHFGGVPTNETLIFWYELLPTLPSPIVNWSYFGEGTGTAVFYPSMAVNCHGDIGIGYSRTSATINVSTGFAFIPAGTSGAAPYNLAAGGASYVRLDTGGRNRWGDYSATVVDPRDGMSFWTIQESAAATANRWTTRWAQFPHNCAGAPVIFAQPENASFCPGATLTVSLNASGSGNAYQWFRDGNQIPGALGPTLLISNAATAHSGIYHAIVTNNCGVTRSADAVVRVGLTIAQQPVNITPTPCDTVGFTVGVAFPVGAIQYRWHKEFAPLGINIPLNDDGHFSGTQTGTLTIHGVRYEDEGRYTCRVVDPACTNVELFSQYATCSMSAPLWAHRTTSGPSRRPGTDLVYDASRGVCVLYGGYAAVSPTQMAQTDETWEWDGVEWTRRFPVHTPGPRAQHELVYDSLRNKVLLFGGFTTAAPLGNADVWEYDGNDWTLLTTSPGGPPTFSQQQGDAAFDAVRGKMILLGEYPSGLSPNRTWEFDPGTLVWQKTFEGAGGVYWYDSPIVYDPAQNAVYGTSYAWWNLSYPHTWRYTGTGWEDILNSAMPSRQDGSLAFDTFRQRTMLFACCRHTGAYGLYHNDTYAFDGTSWQLHLPEFQPVLADRLQPAGMAFDSKRNAMVVVGNSFNTSVGLNPMDTWEYRYLDRIVFDRQPQDQPLMVGGSAQFKVFAVGAGTLSYQWRKGSTPLANGPTPGGSVIAGATTNTLTISGLTAADAGAYRCEVSNACGAALSNPAQLGSTCYPDCNNSGSLNVADFGCFQSSFVAGNPYADCNQSGGLSIADFACFQSKFAAGCP